MKRTFISESKLPIWNVISDGKRSRLRTVHIHKNKVEPFFISERRNLDNVNPVTSPMEASSINLSLPPMSTTNASKIGVMQQIRPIATRSKLRTAEIILICESMIFQVFFEQILRGRMMEQASQLTWGKKRGTEV